MKMMNLTTTQEGVTLLEVLVGFVIFTSSLVAILDYVSGQIYHSHLSLTNLQKVQMIYEFSSAIGLNSEQLNTQTTKYDNFNLTVLASTMESSDQRDGELLLNRYDYSVLDSQNAFAWAVIKVD